MRGNKFNIGLIAGVLITIGVLAVVGLSTLRANAALRLASPDVGATASLTSQMPKLGEVTFKGFVEQINADSYVVSGMTFRVDMQTLITPGLVLGDEVKVKALLLPDQTRYALSIEKIDKAGSVSEPKFEFYGIVESMGSPNWMISGEAVQVDAATVVDAGVAVGSLVEVEGRLVNGGLLASKIHLEDDSDNDSMEKMNKVEFEGMIESISDGVYVIGGKTVHTDASTEIKGMLAVGDMVKVEAFLQTDGSYLAHEIEIEKEDDFDGDDDDFEMKDGKLEFTGMVDSINGDVWIIAGYTIMVGPGTEIEGNPQPGDQVKVEAFLQADGVTYLAHEIESEDDDMHEDDSDSDDDRDDDHDDDDEDEDDDHHDDDHDDDDDHNDHDDEDDDDDEHKD